MCHPMQQSAARGHNSEGSFQFMKPCWVQLLLSWVFTCACVGCACTALFLMSVYRHTDGFLICLVPTDLLTDIMKIIMSVWNKEEWECCTVQWTVEYHWRSVRLQYQLDHNAMMTRVFFFCCCFFKAPWAVWIWVLAIQPVPLFDLNQH